MKLAELLSMSEAAGLIPTKPSPHSVARWCTKGLVANDGTVVKLAHSRFGKKLFTTAEDIVKFAEEKAEHDLIEPVRDTKPAARTAMIDAAEACEKAGI